MINPCRVDHGAVIGRPADVPELTGRAEQRQRQFVNQRVVAGAVDAIRPSLEPPIARVADRRLTKADLHAIRRWGGACLTLGVILLGAKPLRRLEQMTVLRALVGPEADGIRVYIEGGRVGRASPSRKTSGAIRASGMPTAALACSAPLVT